MNRTDVAKLCRENGVKNEKDLLIKLAMDANSVPCICCGKQIPIGKIRYWYNGDPVCSDCK